MQQYNQYHFVLFVHFVATRQATKGKNNIINVFEGQGLANKSKDKPISEVPLSIPFCDVTLASVDDQKFKAHNVILSASSIFFKKLLGNNWNYHLLIFMRKMEKESNMLH